MNKITELKIKKLYSSPKYEILSLNKTRDIENIQNGVRLYVRHRRTNKEYSIVIDTATDLQSVKQRIHSIGLN